MYFSPLLLGMLLILAACTPKSHWNVSQIDGGSSQFRSSRLSYVISNASNSLQMEIIRREKALKGYLFVQGRTLLEHPETPKHSLIFVQIKEETNSYLVSRYEGGQRLLLPDDLLQKILKALKDETEVTLKVSGYQTTLTPAGFSSSYEKWQKNTHFPSFIKSPF
ncbi:MAG: hypothetical protein JSS09_06435 [Verrucomicrobia bacterium]|nr:hypothetical protein [Verrucomicrobiota bacterium]